MVLAPVESCRANFLQVLHKVRANNGQIATLLLFSLRNKLNMFNLFRLRRKDEISLDIVAETGNIVAKNGNNVEATFDFVDRTKFYDTRSTLLPFVATESNVASTKSNVASKMLPVASTLLLVWTGLQSA